MKHHYNVVTRHTLPFIIVCLMTFLRGQAQSVRPGIKGLIENEKGEPVQGASVEFRNDQAGIRYFAVTNTAGIFEFQHPRAIGQCVFIITHVGYAKQTIVRENLDAEKEESLYIILKDSVSSLNGMVVVGYGTQRRSAVSGAVADVQMDKVSSRSVNTVADIMQGKAPGVVVTNEGGDPTATPRVYIRGLGGINGEQPLYVVDGSIINGAPTINPNDIESISVLKDASAAIYGARASGGVVIITTRKGKTGHASITLDAKYGVQSAWKKMQALNAKEYADVMNAAADNAGNPRLDAFNASIYPEGQITRTNWVDDIFRTGKINDYNVNIDGGNDRSNYFMSFGYRKAEGILLNTYTERYNFMVNSEHQLKPWLKLGEKLNFSSTNGNGANTNDAYTGAILSAIFYPPSIAPYAADGSFSGLPAQYAGNYGDVINPVAYLKRLDASVPVNTLFVNPYLEIKLLRGLVFRSNLAVTKRFSDSRSFNSRVLEIGKIFDYNQLSMAAANYTGILAEQTLSYNKGFGDHHLSLLAGYTYQHDDISGFSVYAQGFADEQPAYRYFTNSTQFYQPSSYKTQSALISYMGRINYDYKNRYLLTLIGRRDGSSLVAGKNRFRNYGSVSAGWIVSKEDWLDGSGWLSNLKLRSSYGILGNLGSLPAGSVTIPLSATTAYLGQTPMPVYGYAETALSNPDITWAYSKQINFGIDAGLFNNRLSIVADYFIKTTADMLISKQPASTSGVANPTWINGGKARDKGIELGLSYNSPAGSAFQYSIGVTATKLSNELISLNQGVTTIPTSDYNIRGLVAPLLIRAGSPLYSYYVVQTAGLFKSQQEVDAYVNKDGNLIQPNAKPGDLKFIDANKDGKIDNNDRVVKGSAYPDFTYGFSLNMSYKNFDLNIFLQGVQGNKLFNGLKFLTLQTSVSGQNYNMLKEIKDAWSPENPNSSIPRVSQKDNNGNFSTTSDWFIEQGSYMRIKNVTLGYSLPGSLVKQVGLGSCRIYLTANNLFTFTRYFGFDPEVGMDNYGIDLGRYPQARSFIAGLNVNF